MPEVVENTLDNFFKEAISVEESKTVENVKKSNAEISKEEFEALKKELNDTKSKLGASSAEAKRLSAQINEIGDMKDYAPIIDLLKKDEGAVAAITNYVNSSQSVQDSVKAELGLSEDFEYDQQEAINDPNSDSAKVMNRMMEKTAERIASEKVNVLTKQAEEEKRRDALMAQAKELQIKHKLDAEQLKEFISKIDTYQLTLEDMFMIINKDKIQENFVNNIVKEKLGSQTSANRSLGSSSGGEKSVESKLMDAFVNSDTGEGGALADFFKA